MEERGRCDIFSSPDTTRLSLMNGIVLHWAIVVLLLVVWD